MPGTAARRVTVAAAAGPTLAAAVPLLETAALALITARATSARKRSLTWSSKRCSRGEGLRRRKTTWPTTTGTPGAAGTRGTRRARRSSGEQAPGPGFGSGQPLDVLRPGPALAGEADRVHTGALRRVSDDELTGMIKAWRRLSSWATARELGAIAEFARRRPDEDPGPGTDSDVARRARARRAASNSPEAAKRVGSAQTAQPGGANPAAQTVQPGGGNPAARGALADGTAGANSAAQAPRLLRLAGRTRRLRRTLPPVGGPAPSRAFPR